MQRLAAQCIINQTTFGKKMNLSNCCPDSCIENHIGLYTVWFQDKKRCAVDFCLLHRRFFRHSFKEAFRCIETSISWLASYELYSLRSYSKMSLTASARKRKFGSSDFVVVDYVDSFACIKNHINASSLYPVKGTILEYIGTELDVRAPSITLPCLCNPLIRRSIFIQNEFLTSYERAIVTFMSIGAVPTCWCFQSKRELVNKIASYPPVFKRRLIDDVGREVQPDRERLFVSETVSMQCEGV